jgi:ATP/maltotriose-dependent transcriptional regulator MalT
VPVAFVPRSVEVPQAGTEQALKWAGTFWSGEASCCAEKFNAMEDSAGTLIVLMFMVSANDRRRRGLPLAPRELRGPIEALLNNWTRRTAWRSLENSLTTLTVKIARLVSQGLSNKGIGRLLNIADGTIKVHLS